MQKKSRQKKKLAETMRSAPLFVSSGCCAALVNGTGRFVTFNQHVMHMSVDPLGRLLDYGEGFFQTGPQLFS